MTDANHPTPRSLRELMRTPEPPSDAKKVFDDYRTCDVILRLLPTGRQVFAHKNVLETSSEYFAAMFGSAFAESSKSYIEIEVPASEHAMLMGLASMYPSTAVCVGKVNRVVILGGECLDLQQAVDADFVGLFVTGDFLGLREITQTDDFVYPTVSPGVLERLILMPTKRSSYLEEPHSRTPLETMDAVLSWGRTAEPTVVASLVGKLAAEPFSEPLSLEGARQLQEHHRALFNDVFSANVLLQLMSRPISKKNRAFSLFDEDN
ncbi:hypothetical protein DFJ73DRAFT_770778 [Zopfochytrium polystomum]|nr:hypothetical protein DFJ73DRAFT_770778 [Zopfochytrium polystomum]